ncbi:MAG: hypothetical protein KatS3mg109_0807 [Pirellulaceae bacterium]|nr:MAG: hypothetical protein KatS3mg109_0807 [Pirellulaceae bacterium]
MQSRTILHLCPAIGSVLKVVAGVWAILVVTGIMSRSAFAADQRSAEEVFPDSTRLFVSIPDPALYRRQWQQTELGKLFRDPLMKPFAEDLRRQLDEKIAQTSTRLGLRWDDIEGIAKGEVAFGLIQLPDQKGMALALLAHIGPDDQQLQAIQQKVRQEFAARGGQERVEQLGGYPLRIWTFPPTRDNPEPSAAVFAHHGEWLVAADHIELAHQMLQRLDGQGNDVLAKWSVYRTVMDRAARGSVRQAHLRWFLVPLDVAQAIRDSQPHRERGRDKIRILREQGFASIRGVGGVVELGCDGFDSRYEIYVHAPVEERVLAARMLDFPADPPLQVPGWVPADASAFLMTNWKMREAFEASKTLVDALAGSEVFEDALRDIEVDPNGLRVNLRREFIAYLGTRVYMLTRHTRPTTPQSEQRLVAFELTDADRVAATLTRALPRDPNVKVRQFGRYTVWEIVRKENIQQARPQGFQGFRRENTPAAQTGNRQLFKNGAMAVAYGYLFYATDVEFLGKFLTTADQQEPLTGTVGFQAVTAALRPLGDTKDECCRYYVYLGDALETDYELFRTGRMVDSETLLGQLLNYFLAPDEEGLKRQPLLDGSKLPEFSRIRQYLQYGGFRVFVEPQGWRIAGGLLARDQRRAARHE